ncbi:MAG: hypothetical protein AB1486_16735 [Planctomycetota bacterium]
MAFWIPVEVDSYSGFRAEQEPRVVGGWQERIEVAEILDRWYEGGLEPGLPAVSYFRVLGKDGTVHLLRHDVTRDRWYIGVLI